MTFIAPAALEFHAQHKARQARYLKAAVEFEGCHTCKMLEYRPTEEEKEARANLKKRALDFEFKSKSETSQLAFMAARAFVAGMMLAAINSRKTARVEDVIKVVGEHFELTPSEITSHIRTLKLIFPRHIAMAVSNRVAGKSLNQIGRRFGGRDHTTIINGIRKIEARIAAGDVELGKLVDSLAAEVTMAARESRSVTKLYHAART